jgi:hypothetical protein
VVVRAGRWTMGTRTCRPRRPSASATAGSTTDSTEARAPPTATIGDHPPLATRPLTALGRADRGWCASYVERASSWRA